MRGPIRPRTCHCSHVAVARPSGAGPARVGSAHPGSGPQRTQRQECICSSKREAVRNGRRAPRLPGGLAYACGRRV